MVNRKKKLLIIGPYPPPFGGVSIHIKRLITYLKNDFEITSIDDSFEKKKEILNIRTFRFIPYAACVKKADIVHIHSGHFILRFLHFVVAKFLSKEIIVTMHSYSERNRSKVEQFLNRLILKKSSKVVFVNSKISKSFNLTSAYVKEAFLPPLLDQEDPLPSDVRNWISVKKAEGYSISCSNAYRLEIHNNQDLYGLDLCIEAAKNCKENNIKIAFIFVISHKSGKLCIEDYKQLVKTYELESSFLIYDSYLSFVRLINECDIVLRPTSTDGDALTIREGLFYGKTVIASDVVKRPLGTLLFRNRDTESLTKILRKTKNDLTEKKESLHSAKDKNERRISKVLDFYLNVLYEG